MTLLLPLYLSSLSRWCQQGNPSLSQGSPDLLPENMGDIPFCFTSILYSFTESFGTDDLLVPTSDRKQEDSPPQPIAFLPPVQSENVEPKTWKVPLKGVPAWSKAQFLLYWHTLHRLFFPAMDHKPWKITTSKLNIQQETRLMPPFCW